jgi:cysteinyl-tRNA synthetase
VLERYRGIELRYYLVSAHYRSHVEFSFEALDEAAAAFRRIEGFLERAAGALRETGTPAELGGVPRAFIEAMDDDLGTPAAVAVLFDAVRSGNRLLDSGAIERVSDVLGAVHSMLEVLGLNPDDVAYARGRSAGDGDERLTAAVDSLVAGLLEGRARARADKDWARADAIRDQIKAAGIEVEDTPDGPKWSIS